MAKTAETVQEKTETQNQQGDSSAQAQADPKTQAQAVDFAEAPETEAVSAGGGLDILLDMHVPVTVAIGQTEITVRRLLQLGPGSILKLDKPIDAPADLYLRDTKFATGSIVVVDGRFAVKIKNIAGLESATVAAKK
jgi:flagellar motor switch protein FliN/FliY